MQPRPVRRTAANIRKILRSAAGAFDLPSILVGVVVVGILTAGVLAAVFGVIPFTQDNAARQDLDSVRTAEGVAKAKDAGYMDKAGLVDAPYLSSAPHLAVGTDPAKSCYLALSKSGTGKIFYSDSKSNEAKELVAGATVNCLTAAQTDTLITEVGGYGPGGSYPSAGGPGGDAGGSDGYSPDGIVPVGYTYGANFGTCPAPFADALEAKFLADGSQSYFVANSLPWNDPGSDAAWDAYYVLDDAAWEKKALLTPSQQKTFDNFDDYASRVPGYDELEDIFWDTPNQADFNRMNELMASAVPEFCGDVSAGAPTFQCAPGVKEYLALSNAYYRNYMYENQRYTAVQTTENYNAWVSRPSVPQEYADDAAKQDAYNNVVALNGSDWVVTAAQNQVRAENTASWAAFQADTARANFDTWVNYEYPLNVCR